jgi:hypothetical protein
MSQSFIDRSLQQNSDNNQSETTQKKIDPKVQANWIKNMSVDSGWGMFNNKGQATQMFAKEEEEQGQDKFAIEEELQMKEGNASASDKSGHSGTKTSMKNDVQSKMDNSFGMDFRGVNIHQNSEQASNIGALAYVQGYDVDFYTGLARTTKNSMKGIGTNEKNVFNSLAKLEHDPVKLKHFQDIYKILYKRSVISDIKDDFSDNYFSGNELAKALAYLEPKKTIKQVVKEKKDTKPFTEAKVDSKAKIDTTNISTNNNVKGNIESPNTIDEKIAEEIIVKEKEVEKDNIVSESKESGKNIEEVNKQVVSESAVAKVEEKEDATEEFDASQDMKTLRETFEYQGWINSSVGINMTNKSADVKLVAKNLVKKKVAGVPDIATKEGKYTAELGKAIKKFQKGVGLGQDGQIGAHGGTIRALLGFSSEKTKIYSGRTAINAELNKRKFNTPLKGSVGKSFTKSPTQNYPDDVKLVAAKIQAAGIELPSESLLEGKSSEVFIQAIKNYQDQKMSLKKPGDGNITKGGVTDKHLNGFQKHEISTLTRNGKNYSKGAKSDKYYEAIDAVQDALDVKDGDKIDKALDMARKAATETKYFNDLTKDISSKVIIAPEDISLDGITLSSVLETRMRYFHKFMVAAGLYIGDMNISDGVRSPEKAHRFSVQYNIVLGNHKDTIKKNLIYLYNKNIKSGAAKDVDGNTWALKEHFKKDKNGKATDVYYDKVKAYVNTLRFGRDNITDPAAAGYETSPDCLPLPIGKKSSNHTKGLALDIDSHRLVNKKEAIIDLIALNFGLVRSGGVKETWHFELSNLGISSEEQKIINTEER